jgi:TRAP-type C4-dicarboxylate transport system permease small subunit
MQRAWVLAELTSNLVNRLFVLLACGLAVLIVLVVLYDVIMRALATPPVWAHDVTRYAFLYLFFFSLGPALASGHHVIVDMFDRIVPAPLRPLQNYAAALLAIVFGIVLFWELLRITEQTFADGRMAPAVVPIPLKWIFIAGPIGAAQFVFAAVIQLGRAFRADRAFRPTSVR